MRHLLLFSLMLLPACAVVQQIEQPRSEAVQTSEPGPAAPPKTARTVEEFDTTTTAERAAAEESKSDANEKALGQTVASLGDVTEPGFWMSTPLVNQTTSGRIGLPGTDKVVNLELRPIEGGSSRISLAAFRVLGAPLTDLVTVEVFAGS